MYIKTLHARITDDFMHGVQRSALTLLMKPVATSTTTDVRTADNHWISEPR